MIPYLYQIHCLIRKVCNRSPQDKQHPTWERLTLREDQIPVTRNPQRRANSADNKDVAVGRHGIVRRELHNLMLRARIVVIAGPSMGHPLEYGNQH
jgi:hypothetical protein